MAVVDHPVHEKTRQKDGFRYGCNSVNASPLQPNGYWAPQRKFYEDGRFEIVPVFIVSVTSKRCRSFYLWDTDPGCADCNRPRDLEYAALMQGIDK